MRIDEFLAELEGVRRHGRGWTARCPAHEDRSPSLSVAEGDDGRILLRCFAGCTADKVTAALGLRLADLFGERERLPTPRRPTTPEERRAAEVQRQRRTLRRLELDNRRAWLALDRASLVLGECLHLSRETVLETLWRVAGDEVDRQAAAAAEATS